MFEWKGKFDCKYKRQIRDWSWGIKWPMCFAHISSGSYTALRPTLIQSSHRIHFVQGYKSKKPFQLHLRGNAFACTCSHTGCAKITFIRKKTGKEKKNEIENVMFSSAEVRESSWRYVILSLFSHRADLLLL